MSLEEYNQYKKELEKKITVNKLLKITSGGESLVIGTRADEGNYYSPSVENSKWLWKGTCTQWFKDDNELNDLKESLGEKEVRFVSTIPSKNGTALRILI